MNDGIRSAGHDSASGVHSATPPTHIPVGARPWLAEDYSRVPYEVFTEEANYELERAAIFRGPVWNYLALEVEIPNPGDYVVSYVGDIQVVVNRMPTGSVSAFVNTCAHRGAQIVRRLRGHTDSHTHTCAYHQWCFGTDGRLIGLPQLRGVRGKGGMGPDFDRGHHGLTMLRVETFKGLIFGTFCDATPPLYDSLGPKFRPEIERIFARPVRVLGYWRQAIPANWKLYIENIKDFYHGSTLHLYHTTFGIFRATMTSRMFMDETRGNSVLHTADINEDVAERATLYQDSQKYRPDYKLRDPSLFDVTPDYDDKVNNMIMSIFPSVMIGQVANTFQTRHIRPKGVDQFELFWTYLGFEGDDAKTTEGRMRQANFIGPAGFISLEDGEAGRLVQTGIRAHARPSSVIEMGGKGPIGDQDTNSTEVAVRGFWKRYHELMQASSP